MWRFKNGFVALVVTFLVVMAGFGIGSAVADSSIDGNSTIDYTPVSSDSIADTTVDNSVDKNVDKITDETADKTTDKKIVENVDKTTEKTADDTTVDNNVDENAGKTTDDTTVNKNVDKTTDKTADDTAVDKNVDKNVDKTTDDKTTDDTTVDKNVDKTTDKTTDDTAVDKNVDKNVDKTTDKTADDTSVNKNVDKTTDKTADKNVDNIVADNSNDQKSKNEKIIDEEDEEVVCETPEEVEEVCEEAPEKEVVCKTPTKDVKCVETSPQAVDLCVNNTTEQANISGTDEPKENILNNFIKSILNIFNGNNSSETTLEQTTVQNTSTPADKNLTIHFLDVGQGDSILIEFNNSTMLIDAGESGQEDFILDYLQNQGISTLNYVVATHPHSDHIGGMDDILNNFQVDNFIDSGYPHTTQTYEDMLTIIDQKDILFEIAQAGHKIDFDPDVDIEILNPGTTYSDELNENFVVLKINYEDISFLLMGDAGLETEENIMKAGYDVDSDILKVGHHGSQSGSGEAFISAVSPEVSVIEVGAENDYGHPDPEILERLQKVSKVYRTDLDGTVTVTTDGSTYTVTTQKSDTPYVSPDPVLTEINEVIPTETSTSINEVTSAQTSTSEPVKARVAISDTTDASIENDENSKSASTTAASNTIDKDSKLLYASLKSDVYHSAGCQFVKRIKPENLITFNSQKEAEAAGYRACKVCGGK
ncbi:MAG TPA: MBL fold metallo-hydrolase [Methanosarcina thermophila]|nr:MBL fold metallo-hydrolase [Methanosarcina thermophila]